MVDSAYFCAMQSRWRLSRVLLAAVACVGALAAAVFASLSRSDPPAVTLALAAPPGARVLDVGGALPARPVAPGFIGL